MSREFNSEEQAALDSGKVDQAVHDEVRQAKRYRFFRAAITANGAEKDALENMMFSSVKPNIAGGLDMLADEAMVDMLVDEVMSRINFEG